MTTRTMENRADVTEMQSSSFEQFAAICSMLAGIAILLYSLSFLVLHSKLLSGLFLMLTGLLATAVLTALYSRLRETDATFALWAFVLALVGSLGAAIHGGFDLATAINNQAVSSLPSAIDPRGLLTFGVTGIGVFSIAWLIGRSGGFPRGLNYWGYLLGVLQVVLYVAYLIITDTKNPVIAVDILLTGFIVNPIWYLWLGYALWRGRSVR